MEKMSKFRLGLIGLLSMLSLGLAFAQSYTADFSEVEDKTNSYQERTFALNGQNWRANRCAYNDGFILGFNNNSATEIDSKYITAGIPSGKTSATLEMLWDATNISSVSFTCSTGFGTVNNMYLLESTDKGNTYTIVASSTELGTISYTPVSPVSSARYTIATNGSAQDPESGFSQSKTPLLPAMNPPHSTPFRVPLP